MTAFFGLATRKWTSAISASALAIGLLVSAPAAANGCSLTGAGSSAAPYQISNRAEFLAIPSCDGAGKHFLLINDVELTNPAGATNNSYQPFALQGIFNGGGYTLDGITLLFDEEPVQQDRNQIGLFSELLAGAEVSDLIIEDAAIAGAQSVGVLAGSAATATVERVRIKTSIARGSNRVGGLIGDAIGTELTSIMVEETGVVALSQLGGLVGRLDARGMNSMSNLFFEGYLAQDRGLFFGTEEGIAGLFGQLFTDRNFSLNRSGANVSIDAMSSSGLGSPGGLIGIHQVSKDDSQLVPTLYLNQVFAVSDLSYNSTLTPFGLVVGITLTEDFNESIGISLSESYAWARVFSDAAAEPMAVEPVTSIVNTGSLGIVADSYYYGLDDPAGILGPNSAPGPIGSTLVPDGRDLQSYEFWVEQGFDILQPSQNQRLLDGGVQETWYHAAYYANLGQGPFFDGFPILMWMVEDGILGPVGFAVPTGAPKSVQASEDVSLDVYRGSWVDAPETDRIYFDGFFETTAQFDDDPFSFVPADVSCTDGFQAIAADEYGQGYFISNSVEIFDNGQLRCFRDGERYRPELAANSKGYFDLGFEFEIAGQQYSHVRPQTNGTLFALSTFADGTTGIRAPYDVTPFGQLDDLESVEEIVGKAAISPLGLDLEFTVDSSIFWAARTEIEGSPAVIFTWENFSIFSQGNTRPNGEFASFQVAFIDRSAAGTELWYNYGAVEVVSGASSGTSFPTFRVNFESQVVPGTNRLQLDHEVALAVPCEPVSSFDDHIWFLKSEDGSSITDPNLRAAYLSMRDSGARLYVAAAAGSSTALEVFTDAACSAPLVINQRQNYAVDGILYVELGLDSTSGSAAVAIGHAGAGGSLFEPLSYQYFLANVPLTELVNGGAQELISQSVGTTVPGRIVTLLPRTAAAQSPSYSGPVAGAPLFRARAGELATISGQRLGDIRSVSIDGVVAELVSTTSTSFSFIVPRETAPGLKSISVVSDAGSLVMQDILMVEAAAPTAGSDSTQLFSAVIRRTSDSEAKMYVRDIEGAGKVQFMLNGREIGWVRASDATDPKLRVADSGAMAGRAYFVRTARLEPGKNVLEIYVDGERVRRVAYGR